MADNPVINGHKYGWASVEAHVDGIPQREFTEIAYSAKVDVGKARGAGTRVLGRTRGEADHEGSVTMLKAEAERWFTRLGHGFMLKSFPITVSYDETGDGGVKTDSLLGCRITNVEDNPKTGTDPLTVKVDLHIMRIRYNGIDPIGDPSVA
jgi:hypothetical protein